jgi:hypothetical protein
MYDQLFYAEPSTGPGSEPDGEGTNNISQERRKKKEEVPKPTRPYHRKTAEEKERLAAEVDR